MDQTTAAAAAAQSSPCSDCGAGSASSDEDGFMHVAGRALSHQNAPSGASTAAGSTVGSSDLADMALGTALTAAAAAAHPRMAAILEDDRAAVLQPAPRLTGRWTDVHVKYLLVGEPGVGKTAFQQQLATLLAPPTGGAAGDPAAVAPSTHDCAGGTSSMDAFRAAPASMCTKLGPITIPEARMRLHVNIQEVPGWGGDTSLRGYMDDIIRYLLAQQEADYNALRGNRALPASTMAGCLQHSVTACLYLLPPHRIKPVDVMLMAALSKQVALIPIAAKADSMTADELTCFRQHVLEACANPERFVSSPGGAQAAMEVDVFRFDADDLAALRHEGPAVPPLAIIASANISAATREPVRSYAWGAASALDRRASDYILLQRLLTGDKSDSLWRLLEDSWARYVRFCDAYEAGGLEPLVEAAGAACGPANLAAAEQQQLQGQHQEAQETNSSLAAQLHEAQAEAEELRSQLQQLEERCSSLAADATKARKQEPPAQLTAAQPAVKWTQRRCKVQQEQQVQQESARKPAKQRKKTLLQQDIMNEFSNWQDYSE